MTICRYSSDAYNLYSQFFFAFNTCHAAWITSDSRWTFHFSHLFLDYKQKRNYKIISNIKREYIVMMYDAILIRIRSFSL